MQHTRSKKVSDLEEPEEPREYDTFPGEAIKYLPEEWQQHLYALKEEGRGGGGAGRSKEKLPMFIVEAIFFKRLSWQSASSFCPTAN